MLIDIPWIPKDYPMLTDNPLILKDYPIDVNW